MTVLYVSISDISARALIVLGLSVARGVTIVDVALTTLLVNVTVESI